MCDNELVTGYIENIIYTNNENGYAIFIVNAEKVKITCVGVIPNIKTGELVELGGNWTEHKKYGKQFAFNEVKRTIPNKTDALVKYLSSGLIKGIGEKTAIRIVETFKNETIDILENNPIRLAEVKGISEKKAILLGETIFEQKKLASVIMLLAKYNISSNIAMKAYKEFKDETLDTIKSNPYKMCIEGIGLNFKSADRIASGEGLEETSPDRIIAGILYVLFRASQAGNTYLKHEKLLELCKKILHIDEQLIEDEINNCILSNILIKLENKIYLLKYYNAEKYVANRIKSLCKINYSSDKKVIDKAFLSTFKKMHIELDEIQKEAVNIALYNGVSIISGGPGTGKTTIIKVLIDTLFMLGIKFSLAAPTGRAAKKMEEYSVYEAKTIHRLLEVDIVGDRVDTTFLKNEYNPLECDVIIIDEVSMVDILLFQSLLKALPVGGRVVLIGDVNQLPAIGPGLVLKDMIDSKNVPFRLLSKIYRHVEFSKIPEFSKDVIEGIVPNEYIENEEIHILECESNDQTLYKIEEIYKKAIMDSIDVQVITPSKKGLLGTQNLNTFLQEKMNPKNMRSNEKKYISKVFREKDKVMQIKNNYDLYYISNSDEGHGVYNGDIGYIKEINNEAQFLTVVFDREKLVTYKYDELDQLELAYCTTVHKSQGSEYDCIIIPLYRTYDLLLNRKLLYTAVTRAKKYLYLVGDKKIIKRMISNINTSERNSGLIDMLK